MSTPRGFAALGAAMERVEMERRAGVKRTAEETKAAIRAALAAGPTGPSDHGALIAAAARYAAAWQAHVRADVVHDAASRDYEDGIGGAAAGDAMRAAFDAAEDAVDAAYAELEAAAGALLRAARGAT